MTRRWAGVLLAGCVGAVLFVLLQPDAGVASSVISRAVRWSERLGAPAVLSERDRVEAILNAAMFVPPTLLAALVWPRHPWANFVAYVFVTMIGVEFLQGFFLPLRSAQYVDVVANTAGALVGVVLARTGAHLVASAARRDGHPRQDSNLRPRD